MNLQFDTNIYKWMKMCTCFSWWAIFLRMNKNVHFFSGAVSSICSRCLCFASFSQFPLLLLQSYPPHPWSSSSSLDDNRKIEITFGWYYNRWILAKELLNDIRNRWILAKLLLNDIRNRWILAQLLLKVIRNTWILAQ